MLEVNAHNIPGNCPPMRTLLFICSHSVLEPYCILFKLQLRLKPQKSSLFGIHVVSWIVKYSEKSLIYRSYERNDKAGSIYLRAVVGLFLSYTHYKTFTLFQALYLFMIYPRGRLRPASISGHWRLLKQGLSLPL